MPDDAPKQITEIFKWPAPMELTIEDAEGIGLVKGVLMREGKLKSGDVMTRDNVMQGAGALRATARAGEAWIDIDHYDEKLPEKYTEKYGKEINEPYPVGNVIDCEAVEGKDGKMEVQAIMAIVNKTAYKLIKDGKIKGNSVVDFYRKLTCDKDCEFEGSTYRMNTLVLEEIPNSEGTWVQHVTKDDIGTIIQTVKKDTHAANRKVWGTLNKIIMENRKAHEFDLLGKYQTEGKWTDGKSSIVEFLEHGKDIEQELAKQIAEWIESTPDLFSNYQLEHASAADLIAWWVHARQEAIETLISRHIISYNEMMASNPTLGHNLAKFTTKRAAAYKEVHKA